MPDTLTTVWTAQLNDGEHVEAMPAPEQRYTEGAQIGQGGMGEVWRVRDHLLHRDLVRKVLRHDLRSDHNAIVRFTNEARITAHLQHPGVVPVYDIGTLPDGRPYYTMQEVRGPTLSDVLSTWPHRRLLEALRRVADVLALAHSRGVLHRDLKPDNVMVGEYGQVIVLDWGIACAEPPVGADPYAGSLVGTGPYLAPEMASEDFDRVGPASDVWQLGCLLREILTGNRPRAGSLFEVIFQAAIQPLPDIQLGDAGLAELVARSTAWALEDRYPDGGAFAAALGEWIEGAHRRDRALEVVVDAARHATRAATAKSDAVRLRARARDILNPLTSFDAASKKLPGWELEDQATRAEAQGALEQDQQEQLLHAALRIEPQLDEAHDALAEVYRSRHAEAEAAGRPEEAARWEVRLRAHDRGAHAKYLEGKGTLTLVTEPPAADARLFCFETLGRRLEPVFVRDLGPTPLEAVELPAGSYLVEIRCPGRPMVRLPVHVRRAQHEDGVAPGGTEPTPIRLPEQLENDDLYVPAGWFAFGGDPEAADALPRGRAWLDGFVIKRHPVTVIDYLAFLNDLPPDEARRHAPSPHSHTGKPGEQRVFGHDGERFTLYAEGVERPWSPDLPVTDISWWSASAYAAWFATQTGQAWRLPHSMEWTKAATGVDGRPLPWGHFFEPTWAATVGAFPKRPSRVPVTAYPEDVSPYGLRGAVGNVRDLCLDAYRKEGPLLDPAGRILETEQPCRDAERWRNARGGCVVNSGGLVRPGTRLAMHPDQRFGVVGFRLARTSP